MDRLIGFETLVYTLPPSPPSDYCSEREEYECYDEYAERREPPAWVYNDDNYPDQSRRNAGK